LGKRLVLEERYLGNEAWEWGMLTRVEREKEEEGKGCLLQILQIHEASLMRVVSL
jgi:hypothetical protein